VEKVKMVHFQDVSSFSCESLLLFVVEEGEVSPFSLDCLEKKRYV
jgi:hypothetical protein